MCKMASFSKLCSLYNRKNILYLIHILLFLIIIMESENSLGWKGHLKVMQSNTPAVNRDIFN